MHIYKNTIMPMIFIIFYLFSFSRKEDINCMLCVCYNTLVMYYIGMLLSRQYL